MLACMVILNSSLYLDNVSKLRMQNLLIQMYILSVCNISDQLWLLYIEYGLCLFFGYILNSFYIFNHFSTSGQSNAKIEELLQEDHNAKRRREKYQKQSSLLSKLTRQLSIHDNRASVSSYSNDSTEVGKLLFSLFV
jgi:hypothetical protein